MSDLEFDQIAVDEIVVPGPFMFQFGPEEFAKVHKEFLIPHGMPCALWLCDKCGKLTIICVCEAHGSAGESKKGYALLKPPDGARFVKRTLVDERNGM